MKLFRIKLQVFTFVGFIFLSLFCADKSDKILTYKVEKRDFINKIKAQGVIEAKRFVVIPCPQIWPQPKINTLAPEGASVKKDEIVCSMDAAQVELDHKTSINELESARAEYIKAGADLELQRVLLESQANSVAASVEISRLQSKKLEFVSPLKKQIMELQIQRSEIEMSKINKKLASLKIIQKFETNRLKMKIAQADNKVNRAKMSLEKLTLRSPVDGIVVHAENFITGQKVKEGDALFGGMPILKIPAAEGLEIKLNVNETLVRRIQPGQQVMVNIDALPDLKLTGKVSKIASIGKPISRDSKIKAFEVNIDLDSTSSEIQVGLTTTCEIYTQTFVDTFAIPLDCVFQKDSLNVVYVRDGSKFLTRTVALENRGDNFVVIKEGLTGGEELALTEPSQGIILSSKREQ
jgi:multidrug efflux pump subunit AcrA (membrane-fusion protein)